MSTSRSETYFVEQHDQVANLHCTNTAEPLPHGLDESGFLAEEQIPMFSSHGLEERKPTVPNKKYWTITILLFAATWIAFGTGLILNMKSKQMINMEHSRTSAEFNSLQDQDKTLNASLNGKINSLQQQVDTFNSRLNGEFNSLQDQGETLNSSLNGKINSLQQQVDTFNSRFNGEFNSLQDQGETLNSSLNGKINSLQQQVDTFNSSLNGKINSLRPRVDTLNSRLNDLAMRITDQSGWYIFKGYQYKDTGRGRHTWPVGRGICRRWGGYLAHRGIRSWDSRKAIAEALDILNYSWIGATDLETEGIWKWSNGQNVRNEQWASGQPTNGTNRHCAALFIPREYGTILQITSSPDFAKLINLDCREISYGLCEKRL